MACRVALEINEGRAVRDDVLHVLHVGDIEPGIENLAGYPFGHREPYLASERRQTSLRRACFPLSMKLRRRAIRCGYALIIGRLRLNEGGRCEDKRQRESDA